MTKWRPDRGPWYSGGGSEPYSLEIRTEDRKLVAIVKGDESSVRQWLTDCSNATLIRLAPDMAQAILKVQAAANGMIE